jgi:hypothetical protein
MTKKPKTPQTTLDEIVQITTATLRCTIVGASPLYFNRLSEKAKRDLLAGSKKKSAQEKATTLKHEPLDEYRASAHTVLDPAAPTLLAMPSTAFKKAIMTAALDVPGATKAKLGRLVWLPGDKVPIYGVPQLSMAAVRNSDMARTPDIRTRAVVPAWAAVLTFQVVQPLVTPQYVANLLGVAGITIGVGDWRQEKGSGSNGQFTIVPEDDPEALAVMAAGGRAAQAAALDTPTFFDTDSEELYTWLVEERASRVRAGSLVARSKKEARRDADVRAN